MAVDRLEDRGAGSKVPEILRQHVEVVAVRMQRSQPMLGALLAVVAVVVVAGYVRHLRLAEDPHEPPRQRGLAGGGVAGDAEEDRTGHVELKVSARTRRQQVRNAVRSQANFYGSHIAFALYEYGKLELDVYGRPAVASSPRSQRKALRTMALGTADMTNHKKDRWASGVTPYAEMGYFNPDY